MSARRLPSIFLTLPAGGSRLERWLLSPAALLLAVLLAFFLNSASLPLTDVDEGAFSEATREMLARGNLVSPTLDGEPRHDKPILIYWAQAASVSLLGQSPFAYRLPSLLAALAWLAVLYRFCARRLDRPTAAVAALTMALSLLVGIIARAAIADALFNLCLCLTLFALFDYLEGQRLAVDPEKAGKMLRRVYAAAGLGFLVKGPFAVLLPLLVGFLLAPRAAWRACLYPAGWGIFLAIVLPWHGLVYLDQGTAFFRGFYLKHNVDRYASTFEGHGGHLWYYVAVLPVVLLPFGGALVAPATRLREIFRASAASDARAVLERFLWLWFAVVLVFFSVSRTQLPHYLLYGCTPLFMLLAMHRERLAGWRLAYLPAAAFAVVVAALPQLAGLAAGRADPYTAGLLGELQVQLAGLPAGLLYLPLAACLLLALWRRLPAWQGLLLFGFVQALVLQGALLPAVLEATQGPVERLALRARGETAPIVAWGVHLPSFSVQRQAATPRRLPQPGEFAFTRADRLPELARQVAPAVPVVVARDHFAVLVRLDSGDQP